MSSTTPLIRVLVIDDSAYNRQMLTRMLRSSPLVEVVGTARDGEEALRKTLELEPDLVTLDLEMPRMDGFTFLRLLLEKRPTPVIVVSGRSGEDDVFKALELGAADFIAKPSTQATPELEVIQDELIGKVHAIRQLRMDKVRERIKHAPSLLTGASGESGAAPPVVVIGSSTGGPAALMQILGSFSEAPRCAFLVAQHMPAGFTFGFAERIERLTRLRAREAVDGDRIEPGTVLVAPGGCHADIEVRAGRPAIRVVAEGHGDKYAPSVDRLFRSAAKHFGGDLLAIVLTGMGDDGRKGVIAVKEAGGRVIAESEESAVIFGMPRQAIETGHVDQVLSLADIPRAILSGVRATGRASIEKGPL